MNVKETIQQAAYDLLNELGRPTSSREFARMALERGSVRSTARDPVQSLSQTLEKNVREGAYNKPELRFVHESGTGRRLLTLPDRADDRPGEGDGRRSTVKQVTIQLPADLLDQLKLAEQAKIADTFDTTACLALQRGLSVLAPRIKQSVIEQLDKLTQR